MKILAVCASPRLKSHSIILTRIAAEAAREAGADVEILELAATPLPMFVPSAPAPEHKAEVDRIAKLTSEADAFLFASPEYHGSMTGVAKNYLDFHYHEFAGKLFGIMAATGGSQGTSVLTHMRAGIQFCHGWTLPYHVGVSGRDFTGDEINDPDKIDRLKRVGRDTAVYGAMLKRQFDADIAPADIRDQTFAGWHAEALGVK